jgi:hypothetical protein
MTGVIPMCAVAIGDSALISRLPEFSERVAGFVRARPQYARAIHLSDGDSPISMLALVGPDRLPRILARLSDTDEFLAPNGLRSVSAAYRGHPFQFWQDGGVVASVDYEPAESTTPLFGGNSNWRGPIWFPVNYLVIGALERFGARFADAVTVEHPVGSGRHLDLTAVAHDLSQRLIDIFLPGSTGVRPVFGDRAAPDATWDDALLFHEYFHGDDGRGLGASHQTGWTGLVADLVIRLSRYRQAGR